MWLWQELSDSHSIWAATDQLFHSQPQMLSLWLRQFPQCGDCTPASVPPPTRAGPVAVTLLSFPLVPSFHRVLCGSIRYFPLVRYSFLLSASVLHALLCLKVYSWCIHGERCTPHPPIPLTSCSLATCIFCYYWFHFWKKNYLVVLSLTRGLLVASSVIYSVSRYFIIIYF